MNQASIEGGRTLQAVIVLAVFALVGAAIGYGAMLFFFVMSGRW